ncbi:Pr6Pr family membrane protein [Streptomyces sp. RS10V-4]|uniref:Pr6Pr family membrane protein n=1 Tax=Streptomyces rhizoryzae TaxID=2932493 RepID=UPI0020049375|nr:Pr6Pr family membrane protein [Streptomyces rhizoryzae]MCK7621783.1 Pr6Pr family membrane protein [Streptomyces rhizoryzae]
MLDPTPPAATPAAAGSAEPAARPGTPGAAPALAPSAGHRRPVAAAFRTLAALTGATGIVLDTIASHDLGRLFSYFTIQSNIVLAVVFAWSAHRAWTGRPALSPRTTGAALLYICITGLVFHFVLSNDSSGFAMTSHRTPLESAASQLLHTATPLAAVLDWLLLTGPGAFLFRYAWQWLTYPLLYLPFALVRGALLDPGTDGRYPYPFLDVDLHGYDGIATNAVVFALAFYALALALVLLDRLRPRLRGRDRTPTTAPALPAERPAD